MKAYRDQDLRRRQFEQRLDRCDGEVRRIIDFLTIAAVNAGPLVDVPTYENDGVGVVFRHRDREFVRLDPKFDVDHLHVQVKGGDRGALDLVAELSERQDGPWVVVSAMSQAVRLVPHILDGYDRRSGEAG